jgi:hypothetical protein
VRLSTTLRAWLRWQEAAGPWQGWSVCPALLAPEAADVTPRAAARPAAERLAAGLAGALGGSNGGTAFILDLEPILGIHVAARLNELRIANAVLLLPRWPYEQAVLPVDGLLSGLLGEAPRLQPGNLPNVAFVLDAERRRAIPGRANNDARADNRYRLMVGDLPNLKALRAHGIGKVVKLIAA